MGDSQKSLEILEEGADALDSGSLRRRAERQRAQTYSDQELLDLANDAVITVYSWCDDTESLDSTYIFFYLYLSHEKTS